MRSLRSRSTKRAEASHGLKEWRKEGGRSTSFIQKKETVCLSVLEAEDGYHAKDQRGKGER